MRKLIDIADEHLEALKIQAVKEGKSFKFYLEDKILAEHRSKSIEAEYQKDIEEYKSKRGGSITELAELMLRNYNTSPTLMDYLYDTFIDLTEKEDEFTNNIKWIGFLELVKQSCQSYIEINKESLPNINTKQAVERR